MTLAEIHGKLNAALIHERLEDLLTADIFGPLRYLADGAAPLRLLGDALRADLSGERLATLPAVSHLLTASPAPRPIVEFWPNLAHGQPDLLLTWPLPTGGRFRLLVEVKYLSEKSGAGMTELEDGDLALSDQLGREYLDLADLVQPGDSGALLYLTAHPSLPVASLRESLGTIQLRPGLDLYWLGWKRVYSAIRRMEALADAPHLYLLWNDMRRLLERKGLTGLRPWAELVGPSLPPVTPWYQPKAEERRWQWPTAAPATTRSWYSLHRSIPYTWITQPSTSIMPWYERGRSQ